MKITAELPEPLLRKAKEYAATRGIPLRRVIEMGLQRLLETRSGSPKPFRLKTVTTKGEGLTRGGDWSEISPLIYEGHGG